MAEVHNFPLYINGRFIQETGEWLMVHNPATLEPVGRIPVVDSDLVDEAIAAARDAFPRWAATPAKDRAQLLKAVADRMIDRIDELARLLTLEQGKPLAEARGEIQIAADYLTWSAEEAKRIYGQIVPASTAGKRLEVLRQPIGVVGAITPWNFPASMVTRKIGPALAAGCTVILKPAEDTPLTASALFELFHDAGFPKGTVNLVVGDAPAIGRQLMSSRVVRKLSFTGSTAVGRLLIKGAADHIMKLSLELGGHAPFIVFDDADLDEAVQGLIASKYRNAGQTCICANRLFVASGVAKEFADKLSAAVSSLRIGSGLEQGVEVGPLIREEARERAQRQVDDAVSRGAEVLVGGSAPDIGLPGAFYTPTLLRNVADDALLSTEETFGPVIGIREFETEEEALYLANDSRYGLAAYVYTKDFGRITRVCEGLEYGIVGVNDGVPTVVQAPFGGMKESGWGREGGWQGIDAYLETKFVSIRY